MKEKPSVVKKLMKPHKNILKLTIERPSKQERTYMGQPPPNKDTVGQLRAPEHEFFFFFFFSNAFFKESVKLHSKNCSSI